MTDQLKSIADRFEPGDLLGAGGMGQVFHATDRATSNPVAIKVLHPEFSGRAPEIVERFNREGEALHQLNHPNIVKVLDVIQDEGHHCIVMEYVPGGTLADLLKETPQLPLRRVLSIGLELSDALARAHHLKIIHRDIKPSNVLLAEDGTPRLTDFGVARFGDSDLTEIGVTVGTFDYLSPEAAQGQRLDVRADIWSLGMVLYEMLTGRHPFNEAGTPAVVTSILTRPIVELDQYRSDVPVALADLIYRMLEKNRDARIPRMRMVGAELEAIIEGLDTPSPAAVLPSDTGEMFTHTPPEPVTPQTATPAPTTPNNLPAFTTAFVGRDYELNELHTLLDDPAVRLITLQGPGGIGKTRVAVAAADAQLANFPNGIYYVGLAPISDPANIVTTIAEHLNFEFGGGGSPLQQLLDYLREKALLLVFDNFEHLIEGADVVAEILQAASGVRALVVSRERLRLRGEYVFELDRMILPDESASPAEIAGLPAVQLFMQNATRIMPDFELDEITAPLVARICNLVDGMPLGIELAAAWLAMLPIDEVVAEIEESLDFLETDLRDVPERHRSLRAVFESAWHLMTDDERDVFMKLSVFRKGFTRDAAQKVAGASLRNLTTLVNKSLLRRAPDGRYTPHITLRQYAEDQLAASGIALEELRHAHAGYYADLVVQFAEKFNTRKERAAAESFEVELENVRLAWQCNLHFQDWDALTKMLHPLHLFFLSRSMLSESERTFRELVQALEAADQTDIELYWCTQTRLAMAVGRMGRFDEQWGLVSAARPFFEAHDMQGEMSIVLNLMSYSMMMHGRYDASTQLAQEGLAAAEASMHKEMRLFSLGNWGYAEFLRGNYAEARRIYEEFNLSNETDGSPIGLAFGLNNLGEIIHAMGEPERARDLYQQSYGIFKSFRHRRGMSFTLNNLGRTAFENGEFDTALSRYQESYELSRDIGDRVGMGHALQSLGQASLAAERHDRALDYFRQSLDVFRAVGDKRSMVDALTGLAAVAEATGNVDEATRLNAEVRAIKREMTETGHFLRLDEEGQR